MLSAVLVKPGQAMLTLMPSLSSAKAKGLHNGGDGILREIKFLEKMQISLLTGHRRIAPFGLNGGICERLGKN